MSTMTPEEKAKLTQQQHDTWDGDTEHYGMTEVHPTVKALIITSIHEMAHGIYHDPRFAENVIEMFECMPRAALEQALLTICLTWADHSREQLTEPEL